MLKGDGFGPSSDRRGPRLRRQVESGLTAMQRRYVDVTPEPSGADGRREGRVSPPRSVPAPAGHEHPPERVSGPKGGRPGLGEPWKALGISRAEYFRRRKAGAG
jgi:hypothetical protein